MMDGRGCKLLLTVLAALATAAPSPSAWSQEQVPAEEPPPAPEEAAIAYEIELDGVEGALRNDIEQASRLVSLRERPPASLVALRRRVEEDEQRITDVLRAHGHYDATVATAIDSAARPVKIGLHITPGPAYALAAFRASATDPALDAEPITVALAELGVTPGRPAVAAEIVAAEAALLALLGRRSYPLARITDRRIVVDHASRTVTVDLTVDSGPFARFGPVTIKGLASIPADYVRNRLPWRPGAPFDPRHMEEARKRLVATGLFTSIRIATAEQVEADGLLPIGVTLAERPTRSIGGGLHYSSVLGPGIEAFWEHRNFFGGAERLRASAGIGARLSNLETSFRDPDAWGADRDLLLGAALKREEGEGFTTASASVSAGLEWRLSEIWRTSAALVLEETLEDENGESRDFTLLSLPLQVNRDSTDDLLNPSRGGRFMGLARPFVSFLGERTAFLRLEASDSVYLGLFDDPRTILAGWAHAGVILGASLADLPADKRFYAGGGGSVRGFGYQRAGPLDADGDPSGGLSLLGFGIELRIRVTDSIGLVPFLEAGSAFADPVPRLGQELFWGAGLGLRYYTPVGPVRADLALPLNRREGIDDPFQIYLSLGQAF